MAFYTGFEPDAVGFSEVFLNLCVQDLAGSKIFVPLQSRFGNGAVAQLNRASDYGSEGCGFESLRRARTGLFCIFASVNILENLVRLSTKRKCGSFARTREGNTNLES